jgi:hypothetical protein
VIVITTLSKPQVMPLELCAAGVHAAAHAITSPEAELTVALGNRPTAEDTVVQRCLREADT